MSSLADSLMWGGLIAAVDSLDDAVSDPDVRSFLSSSILQKLDRLQHATSFDALLTELQQAQLSLDDVNRLNSPLLDGLWVAFTGHTPAPTSVALQPYYPLSMHSA